MPYNLVRNDGMDHVWSVRSWGSGYDVFMDMFAAVRSPGRDRNIYIYIYNHIHSVHMVIISYYCFIVLFCIVIIILYVYIMCIIYLLLLLFDVFIYAYVYKSFEKSIYIYIGLPMKTWQKKFKEKLSEGPWPRESWSISAICL